MHQQYLLQALALARIGEGFCAPNPSVGAVIVKDHQVIAQGYHVGPGHAHAEIMALQMAGDEAEGATMYVTLEPCCHYGRTPPCTDSLIKCGIGAVHFAVMDPNPKVAGKGQQALITAGIDCEHRPIAEIDDFYRPYCYWSQTKMPWVTCKLAQSLDGKIADSGGQPRKITGERLREFTHLQRLVHDGILTTSRTVLADNPQLNVRLGEKIIGKRVYVLDRTLSSPENMKLLETASQIVLFHGEHVDPNNKAKWTKHQTVILEQIPEKQQRLCLYTILKWIGEQGCHRLWVESGGQCFNQLITEKWVQQAFLYIAPIYLGTMGYSAYEGAWEIAAGACEVQWYGVGQDGVCELYFAS